MKVTYSSNNSGGGWWLDDDDWRQLEAAGWDVKWIADEPDGLFRDSDGKRFLGALATEASIEAESIDVAVAKWEFVTGERAADQGCSCCGYPHEFYSDDRSGYWGGHDPYDDDYGY